MERRGGGSVGFSGGKRRSRSGGRVRDYSAEEEGGTKMVERKITLSEELYRRELSERLNRDKRAASSAEEEEYEEENDVSVRKPAAGYGQSYKKIHPQKQRNCLSDKVAVLQVPRKARSVSKKRMSTEWLESIHIKNSGRKKMKANNGTKQQKPAIKMSKQPSFIEDELEVAEFLFGLTRLNQENNAKSEPKSQENNGKIEPKSQENSNSNSNPASLPNIVKKKQPAILKSKEDNSVSVASTSKIGTIEPERKNSSDPILTNQHQSTAQIESRKEQPTEKKKEGFVNASTKQHFFPFSLNNTDRNNREQLASKPDIHVERTREPKSIINLMGPPQGLEKKAQIETVAKSSSDRRDNERAKQQTLPTDLLCKERFLNLEFEKSESNAGLGRNRGGATQLEPQQQQKVTGNAKAESRQDKDKAGPPANLSMPMAMGAWPGNLPPIGFMGQVPLPLPPGLLPIPTNPTSNNLQTWAPRGPPLHRPKRCLTHCYLAKLIDYHQKILKMNPFSSGPPPAGAPRPPMFNLGLMPPNSDPSLMQMQGNFNMHHVENNKPSVSNSNGNNSNILENQRKQQMVQSGPMPNMMHGPFMFPMNQQQAAAAMAAAMATANRPNTSIPANPSTPSGRPMNHLSIPGLPPVDPQILTALKNGTFQFPTPAGMAPQFRGGPQSMPWPFYPPQMAPHQQLRPNLGGPQQQLQSNVQKMSNVPSFGPNQANQQDGDKNEGLNNSNNGNNNGSQVQKNVYGQNYAMPFAFNGPRPAITRHNERTEEYNKNKPSNSNSNATSAVGPLQQQMMMGLSELQKKNEKLLRSLPKYNNSNSNNNNNNNNNNNILERKEGGEKNQNATSASGSLQTVHNNKPSNPNTMIELQKKNDKLLQSFNGSLNRNTPPGGERIWSNNSQSDFGQVVKTGFPQTAIKRMESQSPSTSKNNNNNNNPQFNPQNRTVFPGSNPSKTVQTGSKPQMGPTATSPPTSISKSNHNNYNTGGSPTNNMSSKNSPMTKTPLMPAQQQQHSTPKTNSPSVSTPRPPAVLKTPNTPSPYPNSNPNPNSLPKPNQPNNSPKPQVYPRPQFFYAGPQQMQPYANGSQKRHNDNPGPAGMTVHGMAGQNENPGPAGMTVHRVTGQNDNPGPAAGLTVHRVVGQNDNPGTAGMTVHKMAGQNDNPGPAGLTVHRMGGQAQPLTGGAHARVPVSFAYLPVVAPVSSNKGVSDQKQGSK